ncbi:MAG: 2-hydroxy-3-oxopropionate reductase [SAR202 cluster bacterium]|nr:2-hydroxy-3-oxopropionate reductase [SAR202 cluster bacterium]
MPDKKVGFIGLGIMGRSMAKNLIKAGYAVTVFDINPASVKELETAGAKSAASSKAVAAGSDIVVTMVPDSADAEKAIMGEGGVLEGAKKGLTVIDMSSIAPISSQKIAKACEAKGVNFLDAPVSGGEPKAIDGTLAIMVGGKGEVFEQNVAFLKCMGASVVLCGGYGAGNTTKLANQIIVAANIEALAEAMVLVKKAGLDPQVVFEAIKGGLAGSTVMNAKAPMMISGNFKPGFRIRLHQKDLHNALLTGKELGVSLPVTAAVQQMITALMTKGKGDSDHSAIANYLEELAGITISGK